MFSLQRNDAAAHWIINPKSRGVLRTLASSATRPGVILAHPRGILEPFTVPVQPAPMNAHRPDIAVTFVARPPLPLSLVLPRSLFATRGISQVCIH
jgi:hypothetical protein